MSGLKLPVLLGLFFCLAIGFLQGQEPPKIQEEVVVRWWLVPVYATNQDGDPALDLQAKDLEVLLGDQPIPHFDLHVKRYQAAPARQPSAAPGLDRRSEGKLAFLVFDSAFSRYELLERAKKLAGTMIAQEGEGTRFIALSIEPFQGLTAIAGPTGDRRDLARSIEKHVSGKKAASLRSNVSDSTSIRNVYPEGDRRNPDELWTPGRRISRLERLDTAETRRTASVYTRALMTLNLILGSFKDNSKVVYLFSCGIPQSAMDWKTEGVVDPSGGLSSGEDMYLSVRPDEFNRQALMDIARVFNRNGSLLFLVNPLGTRLAFHERDSGEQSLRLLADESGGRYYEGPEQEIAGEIASMENGYYEISFPDSEGYQGYELDLKIRALDPAIRIYSLKRVSRGPEYRQMSGLEREVLVLNLLEGRPFARAQLRVVEGDARVSRKGTSYVLAVRLPPDLIRSEWDVFKVWRDPAGGGASLETERVVPDSPELTVDMKYRNGFEHEAVLVHRPTGTAIVLQK